MTGRVEHLAEGVTLYLGDCREILPTLWLVDALVTDPPYGLADKWAGGSAASKSRWKLADGGEGTLWDDKAPDFLPDAIRLARHSIIWGGHCFGLAPQRGWLVWNKIIRNWSSGECELAWTTIDQPVRAFDYSHGQLVHEHKQHPTQKPEPLMRWCIEQLPPDCQTILDPFMGAGTTGVAAVKMGRKFIGVEIHEPYFDIACKRIEKALSQQDMFVAKPALAAPKQETFL